MLRLRDIQRRFDRAAPHFDGADFVHTVTRDGLVGRLEPLLLQPQTILDLGSATGATGRMLRRAMLGAARKSKRWFSRSTFVQADAGQLPFADESFDMVVSNQLLPWAPDPQVVFEQVSRVLKKNGVFAFATLGPDSLREIAKAWAAIDDRAHVNPFPDMHDIGDGLVRAGLRDPVLDVDRLQVSYETPDRLFADLTRAGARNALTGRGRGLVSRRRFKVMTDTLASGRADGKIVLDLELVYGHCWGGGPRNDPMNYKIDADRIPLRG
jgi:malonyl-CoA O-methyltransferase